MFIENRKEQKIALIVDKVEESKGIAFVMHGLGGFKEQIQLKHIAETFLEKGYTIIRFDTTNTFGKSEGNYEDATVTNYYEDLEDVIKWASKQEFYKEPFFLIGHSLGGICVTLYAQKNPTKIKGLAPIATVISGKLSMEIEPEEKNEWKKTGFRIKKGISGKIKRLKWSHMKDRLKYDLLENVNKLTMPVLMIVGEKDTTTPVEHQMKLFEKLPGKKEIHVISAAFHTFTEEKDLKEIKEIFAEWINSNY